MISRAVLAAIAALPILAARDDRIDRFIKAEMQSGHIPGLSLCVVRDGRIVKARAYGLADVELNVAATTKSEFAIASMTKPVIASAILLLVQDSKLTLDDPIEKYATGLPDSWKDITIRHLLTHTSGIKDHYGDFPMFSRVALDRKLEYTDSAYVKAHVDGGLNFKPGQYWAYSGSNFAFLGMIITKVAGKPYQDFVRERILAPLEMNDTHFIDIATIIPNRVAGYRGDSVLLNGHYTGQTFSSAADVSLISSAGDLCKWELALSAGKIWKGSITTEMWTPARASNGAEISTLGAGSYGLGWNTGMLNGYTLNYHTGTFNTGFSSFIGVVPEKRMGVVVLTNQWNASAGRIGMGVAGLYDKELTPPHRKSVPVNPRNDDLLVKLDQLLAVMFGKRDDISSMITPGFERRLASVPENKRVPPVTGASLIASEDLTDRHLERNGNPIARMSQYRILTGGESAYLTLYLTADGRIADVFAY